MTRILLTGANGQVGWELARSLLPLGEVVALDRSGTDLGDVDRLRGTVRELVPDIIVNAAAYTAVDKAESEEDLANRINGVAPGVLAEEARSTGALLIHYSTDYVFDGSGRRPYLETDGPDPVNAYGRSKLLGEQAIQEVDSHHLILRTSWVYSARGANFLLSMLRLACERSELGIVDDQVGAPTWARNIADATAHIVRQSMQERLDGCFESDVVNLVSAGETSWHGFATMLIDLARRLAPERPWKVNSIAPISSADFPTVARRPAYSRLSTRHVEEKYRLAMVPWARAVELCLNDTL